MSRRAEIFYDTFQSPLGRLFLVFSGKGLTEIGFEGERPTYPRGKAPEPFRNQLRDYFSGRLQDFHQDIVFLHGTDFEKKVWLSLMEVPYGETRTYKWLAERIGNPKAVRAVGHALGSNPIPIVLPCHRIIGSDGSLVGYTGGIDIKRRLLDLEYYYLIGGK
ncbi:MAG: methylated-DNA--[protein]-cysteine S-methyltransferase [Nitrospirae bacterium]|nr:methylated-DNA--[protein]-cysteine S-methyltransferase [Nitrospirota bacterium]MCL5422719.1 methylated-DNA--[protein]-cysteine S-methyltransferase [Nitrospirota bacterium]